MVIYCRGLKTVERFRWVVSLVPKRVPVKQDKRESEDVGLNVG